MKSELLIYITLEDIDSSVHFVHFNSFPQKNSTYFEEIKEKLKEYYSFVPSEFLMFKKMLGHIWVSVNDKIPTLTKKTWSYHIKENEVSKFIIEQHVAADFLEIKSNQSDYFILYKCLKLYPHQFDYYPDESLSTTPTPAVTPTPNSNISNSNSSTNSSNNNNNNPYSSLQLDNQKQYDCHIFYTMLIQEGFIHISLWVDNQMLFLDQNRHRIDELLDYKVNEILYNACYLADNLLLLYYHTLGSRTVHECQSTKCCNMNNLFNYMEILVQHSVANNIENISNRIYIICY